MFISASSQCRGLPFSFLSLVLASVNLFYHQRLWKCSEPDPSLKMKVFAGCFVLFQIAGPLFNLIIMASYLQGYVLLSIACNIGALFVVLYFMYFQKTNREEIKNLYNNCSKPNAREEKILHNETFSIFFTSIFTAWVSPCSVWSVYYLYKTHFLLVSSTITCLCQLVNIISIYCYLNLYSDISGDT